MTSRTISFRKGKGSMSHNNRDFINNNVDKERIKDNIYYKRESLEDAYAKCFNDEVKRYNKGKKPCRQITNYINHIKQSKNGEKLFYENVVQVGNMQDTHCTSNMGQIAKEILDKYMRDFERRNPSLYVFNAALHMDEATPHLHIDYIPIAKGYKNGLQMRNSLEKALVQQGLEGGKSKTSNATISWQEREKNYIEELMLERNIYRTAENEVKTENKSLGQFKTIARIAENEANALPSLIERKPSLMDKNKVIVDKGELDNLEKCAKFSIVAKNAYLSAEVILKEDRKKVLFWQKHNNEKVREANARIAEEKRLISEAGEGIKETSKRLKEDLTAKYKHQKNLSENYDKLEDDYRQLEYTNERFLEQLIDISNERDELFDELEVFKDETASRFGEVYKTLSDIVKAIGMIKWDKTDGYVVDLSKNPRADRLITAIYNTAKKFLYKENEHTLADEMASHIGISKNISDEIKAVSSKRSYGMER